MKTLAELKSTLTHLETKLKEISGSIAIINGHTQQNFCLHAGEYRFHLSQTNRSYMQEVKPHFDRVRVALEAALLEEKFELLDLIKIARADIKEALLKEAESYG